MPSPVNAPIRKLTQDELPVLFALNYATMTCTNLRRFDDAEAINSDAIALYGRLLPTLVCRYAWRVAVGNLNPMGCLEALLDVFTPTELAHPNINLIRLTLVVNGLAKLPGHERQITVAMSELRAIVEDPSQDRAVLTRATALLAEAGHVLNQAA